MNARNHLARQRKNFRNRSSVAAVNGMNCRSWIAWNRTCDLIDLGYISARTARSWRQKRRLPAWAAGWIQLIADGDLGRMDPVWNQWLLRRGELISSDGWGCCHEIRADASMAIATTRLPAENLHCGCMYWVAFRSRRCIFQR